MDSRSQDDDRTPSEPARTRRSSCNIVSNRDGRVETLEGCEPCESADRFTAEMMERMFVAAVERGEAA